MFAPQSVLLLTHMRGSEPTESGIASTPTMQPTSSTDLPDPEWASNLRSKYGIASPMADD